MDMSDERFGRIEDKIDKLVEVVTLMSTLTGAMERVEARVDKMEDDVHEIEKKMPLVDLLLKGMGRAGYVLITILVGGIIGSFMVFK